MDPLLTLTVEHVTAIVYRLTKVTESIGFDQLSIRLVYLGFFAFVYLQLVYLGFVYL